MIPQIKCRILTETAEHLTVRIGDNTMKVDLSMVESIKRLDDFAAITPKSWSCLSAVHTAKIDIPLPVRGAKKFKKTVISVSPNDKYIEWSKIFRYLLDDHFKSYNSLADALNTNHKTIVNRLNGIKPKGAKLTTFDLRIKALAIKKLSAEQLIECRILDQGVAA